MDRYNNRGEKLSKNKSGLDVVFFKDRKRDFFPTALAKISKVRDILRNGCAIDLIPIYGTLLGIIRDGQLIPHDYDFDFCYISRRGSNEEICSEAVTVVECLRAAKIKVSIGSFGFMQIYLDETNLNIYVGWERQDSMFLYFGIPDGIPAELGRANRPLEIYGQVFPSPSDPKHVLKAIYGKGWDSPNPKFSYSKRIQFHKNFNFLISGWPKQTGNKFWDSVYRKSNIPDFPSQFAISVMPELQPGSTILDIGCGNGRDALFFSQHGHHVVGVDASKAGIRVALKNGGNHGLTANFLHVDVYDPNSYMHFIEHHAKCFDVIYARFFIHAIDNSGEIAFWQIAKSCIKKNGIVYIEARTVNDTLRMAGKKISETESISDHYRRFIKPSVLMKNAQNNGFSLAYKVVGRGMAKFCQEDPEVARCTFRKN